MTTKDSHATKTLAPIEIDTKDLTDEGTFSGYASVFGVKDQGHDICVAGAFRDSLIERPAERIKMLWQHDTHKPIGKWLEVREDAHGLYVKGQLLLGVQQGRETYEMMKAGVTDGLSIGYLTIEDLWDRETEARKLLKVSLREVSCVTFPMLEQAVASSVKGRAPTEREIEALLKREAGLAASQAKAFIAGGYKAMKTERDAGANGDDGLSEALRQLAQKLRG